MERSVAARSQRDSQDKSIICRLAIVQVPVSGMWQLRASYPGGYWLCAFRGSEEALRMAVYEEGLELDRAMMARTIFERLVKEGRAETVGAEASAP